MIMIHWPSFAGGKPLGNNVANYCGYPAFRAYRDTNGGGGIFTRDEGEDEPEGLQLARNVDEIEKTSGPVKHAFDSRLVISSEPTHNATALCESTTSRGPDFVSLFEGVYCNMATSETLPLCVEGTLTEGCFHVENQASVGKRAENATEPVVVEKEYTAVIRWD
ncbi:hypothetical protein B0T17DRAFT_520765 [Bombardia bombarda]|uniref:Uncharacterized protein n=1 Tax=Bombardia bombarda TaxID=252184 RepID=A0AA39XP52_9PEZI|nr:hypothetical protein B0T17DRAFT_520765 [Bombardia bombarda]